MRRKRKIILQTVHGERLRLDIDHLAGAGRHSGQKIADGSRQNESPNRIVRKNVG